PGAPVVFAGADAYEYYMVEGFCNEVTLRSMEMSRENEPGVHVSRVSPTPMLMIVASQDTVTPSDLALQAYEKALQPKRLVLIEGGHFSPYTQHFQCTSREAIDWFKTHLARKADYGH